MIKKLFLLFALSSINKVYSYNSGSGDIYSGYDDYNITTPSITSETSSNTYTSITSTTDTSITSTTDTSITSTTYTSITSTSITTTTTIIDIRSIENNVNDRKMLKENKLRSLLFNNYTKLERPVLDFGDNIKLKYGIEIKSLVRFDQKGETIEFNLWITQVWNDEYLTWNITEYEYNYMNIYSEQIWIPDLELYNAASQPIIYDSTGGMKLYSNGDILWIRPTRYSFSCTLDLKKFPFDKTNIFIFLILDNSEIKFIFQLLTCVFLAPINLSLVTNRGGYEQRIAIFN